MNQFCITHAKLTLEGKWININADEWVELVRSKNYIRARCDRCEKDAKYEADRTEMSGVLLN